MRKRSLILERRPKFVTLSDYGQAAKEIDDLLGSLPGVVAVYQLGSVSAPGISDIDRIAVVERSGRFSSVWGRLSASTRYLAMHSPFLVDVETFVRHRWFAVPEPLEAVSGTELALEAPPSHQLLRAIAGIEGLVVSRLKLAKQLSIGRVKVRPFLCALHNLGHDLRLIEVSQAEAPLAWDLTAKILAVRGEWWEMPDHERDGRVLELVYSAPMAIDEALAGYSVAAAESAIATSMRLSAEWKNVTLTNQPLQDATFGLANAFSRVSRRAAELAWRRGRYELALPTAVVSLLSAAAAGADALLAERLAVVRHYRGFLDAQDPGWSRIGFATVFTRP